MKNSTIQLIMIALIVMISGSKQANASLLQLTHDPLFLNQSVPPALAVTFDDSGSMAWGFMGRYYGYDTKQFADPSLNKVYYNPSIVYRPPIGADGVEFPQSSFTNAKIDGFDDRTSAPRVNLSTNFIPIAYYYYYSDGDYSLRFAKIPDTPGVDDVSTGQFNDRYPDEDDRGDSGRAAFYYNGNTRVDVPVSQQDNFANWYTYYSNRLKMGKTAVSRAFATFGPNFKIAWQQLNRNTTFPDMNSFELTHRQNFFNWLFAVPSNGGTPLRNAFYRAGRLFEDADSYQSDSFNANITCQQNFHIALSDGEWNGAFAQIINQDESTSTSGLSGDTDNLYTGYSGTGEQKIYPKSESGTTLSDIAFHFWSRDLMTAPYYKNNVKRYKGDFTKADGTAIAFTGDDEWDNPAFMWNPKNDPAYWQHLVTYNVGMGLEASRVVDYVAAEAANNDADPNNDFTPACDYIAGLSAKEAVYRGLRTGECDWPNATNGANKIDDVWHASINSRGDFFSANDPQELTEALNAVVNNILERLSRGSTSSVSSGVVTSSTKAYTPGFDSSNWTGNLFSRPLNSDGTFGEIEWDLSCELTGGHCPATDESVPKQNNRRVFTMNTNTGNRVRFRDTLSNNNVLGRFNESTEEIRTRLNVTTVDLIKYLLGDQSKEIKNNGALRNRASVLSDIVHSSPLVQLGPSATYDDTRWSDGSLEEQAATAGVTYEKYKIDNQNRLNLTYIGSNSGMLHAVNIEEGGAQGNERWAYIPSKAFENLYKLADPLFSHWSYVDNTPVIGDAFFDSQWNTVLVSGMRYGGQAFFALNVSDTSATRPDLMWEFSDEDDADMGFSYGKASIARIASTGDWVAFIPNGYNNSQKDYPGLPDDHEKNIIGDGSAVLYVVRLSDGELLAKLDTNVGTPETPNGMAPAMPVVSRFKQGTGAKSATYNEDGANLAYAGDLYGNVWRFDLSSSNPADWEASSNIELVVEAQGVKEQPITIQPRVLDFPGPDKSTERDSMVLFATGKYIEIPDRSINLAADQYVVGLLDGIDGTTVTRIDSTGLKEQTMTTNNNLRTFNSYNTVDYSVSDTLGWKFRLPQQGERVANPMALFGREFLLVTSTVTAGEDPCEAGGVSWLLAFDPMTGYKPGFGDLFEAIEVTDDNGTPVTTVSLGSGIRIDDLIIGSPPIVENQGGGNSSIIVEGADTTTVIGLSKFTWRRRAWKNILTE
ncbi:pilus assembly protein [Marinicella litoralis]|uniref:Type IV pilus assembly protein PilY1 n=1 Tax=Marinicella litoralis TaxID=644220 RepID=A0A4V6PXU7_9GAMM|nr:PilC/PilY family type IV pilus protein [Marinicella litoralis]TDR18421.1 type IV pilus assembly protein PilY1 [Marinicella litoralis]